MKFWWRFAALVVSSTSVLTQICPGYFATNVKKTSNGLTADLTLAGPACNTFGNDLENLTLQVEYQTDERLHVLIQDADQNVYQVPESVLARPKASGSTASEDSLLDFTYTAKPFTFTVARKNGETLFNTSGSPMIFQSQYLHLRTSLPQEPNIYGLGEHSDNLRANTTNYTRTLWSRDAYEIPTGTNLYGNHPVYFDHRSTSTHGVLLLNSNGMDVKINNTQATGQYLEYNTLGGVFDFYFMAGPTPVDVASQYANIVGLPAMMPYWGLGFHQCRYGYRDVYNVADVVFNYSAAGIPLETMWTDIDYMDSRHVFTLDPQRFPLEKMRELVSYLHQHQQHYIVMVDPAVAYDNYSAFNNGADRGIFLKNSNGSIYEGVVWPGPTAFPDWFHPDTQAYWNSEFDSFFNADTGVDIDALWIDMNEASNFCVYPCSDPAAYAKTNGYPPVPPAVRQYNPQSITGFPADFQPANSTSSVVKRHRSTGSMMGLPDRNLINPPYMIQNAAGSLSNKTLNSNLVHHNGLVEYDTHNMYGTMMSSTSRDAMLSRRPTSRPMVITRSTFLGAGTKVGHWLGDNESTFDKYRASMSGLMQFASLYQVPMVGSDVCGYAGNTTETLCARWAMLGAFSPFYRDHSESGTIDQEFYRWPTVARAAKYVIDIRYRMLDYIYTAMHAQTTTGAPLINPMWFIYPNDAQAALIEYQYFFGNAVLVSPVTEENATSVEIYLPKDVFYDWNNGFAPVHGNATNLTLNHVEFTTIPLYIREGTILPLRTESANTTTELRKKGFNLVIATSLTGTAQGSLYLDEGTLLKQPATSEIVFSFTNNTLTMDGTFKYSAGVSIETITILGTDQIKSVKIQGDGNAKFSYNASKRVAVVNATIPLTGSAKVSFAT